MISSRRGRPDSFKSQFGFCDELCVLLRRIFSLDTALRPSAAELKDLISKVPLYTCMGKRSCFLKESSEHPATPPRESPDAVAPKIVIQDSCPHSPISLPRTPCPNSPNSIPRTSQSPLHRLTSSNFAYDSDYLMFEMDHSRELPNVQSLSL